MLCKTVRYPHLHSDKMNTVRRRGAGTEWGVKQDGGEDGRYEAVGGGRAQGSLLALKRGHVQ